MFILILFAFLGGIVTILSPCILPLLPIILAGSVDTGKRRPLGVITGFVLSFTIFTLFLTFLVNISNLDPDAIRFLAIIFIAFSGFTLISPQLKTVLEKIFRFKALKTENNGFRGGLFLGFSLGLVWTPCVGPILASVISIALIGSFSFTALWVVFAYSLGTALPMFIIMQGGRQVIAKFPKLSQGGDKLQKIFGVIMIIVAIMIYLELDRKFQIYIADIFPNYNASITKLENSDLVKKELEKLNLGNSSFNPSTKDEAPEIVAGGVWLNSDPLKISELKGEKVVLVDFWTYSCINCARTIPYMNDLHKKYSDKGLVIIGVHTPEFEFEKDRDNLARAIANYGIEYPVVQDNNYDTWRAYNNQYWPRKYLINKDGKVIYDHIGEGDYEETEQAVIKALEDLNQEKITKQESTEEKTVDFSKIKSPETYFGAKRNEYLINGEKYKTGEQNLELSKVVQLNKLYLGGKWNIQDEYAENTSENAMIVYQYSAKDVYLVAGSDKGAEIEISVQNSDIPTKNITIDKEDIYKIIEGDDYTSHIFTITIKKGNLKAFAFTFG